MPAQNIAVIGAGPKAAALSAKAYALQQQGVDVAVTVFERERIGANWSGRHGYTDGIQRLCTPAERDIGFPYVRTFGPEVAGLMQARFSWNAYMAGEKSQPGGYSEWVNRDRRPPSHAHFVRYLEFAFDQAGVVPALGSVSKVIDAGGTWSIEQIEKASGDTLQFDGFNGLVVTGPGPASRHVKHVRDKRVLTGVSFWSNLDRVRALVGGNSENPVVIVGGGGTAAAITAWFIRHGFRDQPIILLNNQAMLFTRTTNFFENSLFDDEETWFALKPADRTDFTRRLNRGVVWETVTELLSDAENLTLMPGAADEIRHARDADGHATRDLEVIYTNAQGSFPLPAALVILAAGFDPWAFSELLPDALRPALAPDQRSALVDRMRPDLSLPLDAWPRVHAPNLADALGPGFGSLMVLGAMADRIIQPYHDAAIA